MVTVLQDVRLEGVFLELDCNCVIGCGPGTDCVVGW
jgi:hypothetical protein